MNKQVKLGIGLLGLCALYTASATADISVSTRAIDDTTGGDWRGKYGSCYSVVPWAPRATFPEYQVGPDFQGDSPEQYIISTIPFEEPNVPLIPPEDAACIAGAATDAFDFRVFTKSSPDPNPGHAFVWGFHEPGSNEGNAVLPNTPQWNACRNIFYPATFDSDLFAYDPMSAEIKLDKGGSATVAFYFLSEYDIYQCRTQDYVLYINGNKEAEGTIKDLTTGLYVVFDIDGLEDNAVIRLDTTDTAGGNDPKNCAPLDADLGPNSHLSGIFIDGTRACAPVPSRTKGYWKNHPTVIDGSFDGSGGEPSLVNPPLAFCGDVIDDACSALKFLQKKGGGLHQFMSQGMAALLNCTAFGCPDKVVDLIEANNSACDSGDETGAGGKSWSRIARKLERFNQRNDDLDLPFKSPSALPKYYKEMCK